MTCMAKIAALAISLSLGLGDGTETEFSSKNSPSMGPWGEGSGGMSSADWTRNAPLDGGVPPALFARAMTSLAPHYRDDYDALRAHLQEEHAVFRAESPDVARVHLCCTDYRNGSAVKSALESACGGKSFVRTALNNVFSGYCAVAHLSSASAAEAHSLVHEDVRCSPLTHASKEPESLLAPSSSVAGGGLFGLDLGRSLQDGPARGLVVTMSPGSLPVEAASALAPPNTRGAAGTRGGADSNRKLVEGEKQRGPTAFKGLEERWRTRWGDAQGRRGAREMAEMTPWTSSSRVSGGGDGRRSLMDGRGEGRGSSAQRFHGGKAAGYGAALEHLGEKMGAEGGEELPLSEACGWDSNMSFVHPRRDVMYLRGIHHADHDEATAAACFLGLVGFLSAQPEVMHIHPEAVPAPTNKVLTAYVEGGGDSSTPMRTAGLDGSGEVIGITDTGLDDHSCFFRDDENGLVPRTTMSEASVYPDQRKVIQYVVYADDKDENGHGTHVSGIAAGAITDGWKAPWESQFTEANCEDEGHVRSCLGSCVEEMVGSECHWNQELSCPMSGCDKDTSCDDDTGYTFPCFGNPVDELPEASGMAPASKIAFFDIGTADDGLVIPDNIGDMWDAQYAAGARIMTNSWSLVTVTEPSVRDVELDEWIHDHPDAFVVFGAGNNGYEDSGFNPGSVQSPATAKTAMTVGCSNSGPDRAYAYYTTASSNYEGVMWPEDDVSFEVSPFSARGPVGRFTAKPDVIAPGLMVHSARASRSEDGEETCALDSYGGTSMSAPAIAGAAALVRQYFRQGVFAKYLHDEGLCNSDGIHTEAGLCKAFEPSGYLVKAVLINSAEWLGNMQTVSYEDDAEWMTVLDFAQGFGAVQMASGMPTKDAPVGAFYHENALATDRLHYYSIYVVDPSKDVSVTVAWYDPPSTAASYNLLHDLDLFVMSVESRKYFRSNSYNTMRSMCTDDEMCANKYEFTFNNNLADYMNPVERISIPSSDLDEGYYVIGVRARTLTESDLQAYGLAASGGDLVLHDMAKYWSDLGAETQSTDGNGDEPNPDADSSEPLAPSPVPPLTSSPTLADSSGTGNEIVLAPPGTPSPTVQDASRGAEAAVRDSSISSSDGDDDVDSTAGDGFRQSSSAGRSNDDSSGGDDQSAGYKVVGGDDDGDAGRDGDEEDSSPTADLSGGGSGGESGWTDNSKIAIVASVASAVVLIGVGICLARRRRKGGKDETGSFFAGVVSTGSGRSARIVHVGDESDGGEEDSLEADPRVPLGAPELPSYATAVACPPEEEGTTVISDANGTREVIELTAADESEMSGFYAAVDPTAVSKLVGWGIGRDFARVALRQTENDVPEALKLIAEGNMDEQLAMDHDEMAQEGAQAAAAMAQAPGAD